MHERTCYDRFLFMRYRTWPNAISLLRFPLAAAFVVAEGTAVRGVILFVGALSDYVDGWIARRWGQETRVGEVLDGVADKVFVLAALGSFVIGGQLAFWELLLLLIRDLYTTAGFIVALLFRMRIRFRSRRPGKLVTLLQVFAVVVLLVRPEWIRVVAWVIAAISVYAVADYTRAGLAYLREKSARS